jgi:hypothetical protein
VGSAEAGVAGSLTPIGLSARRRSCVAGVGVRGRPAFAAGPGCDTDSAGDATRGEAEAARAVSLAGRIPVVAAVAMVAAAPKAAPTEGVIGNRARSGAWLSHESGPITSRILPSEMFTKARTRRGSNCVPEQRAISARASVAVAGALYERADVITSKTSAIATMRPATGICSPAIPRG